MRYVATELRHACLDLTHLQIFDPIRVFMVEGKMNDWFDYKGESREGHTPSHFTDKLPCRVHHLQVAPCEYHRQVYLQCCGRRALSSKGRRVEGEVGGGRSLEEVLG